MRLDTSLVVFSILYKISTSVFACGQGFYNDQDDVLELKTDTFKSTVFGGHDDVTYVVQFYNSFCGHCRMFSPIYKQLAARAHNWTSVVRIAAVDCSVDENNPICSESRITEYPSILFYPPGSKSFDNEEDQPFDLRSLHKEWFLDEIEDAIITYVGDLAISRKKHPLVSDAMQPIAVSNIKQVKRIYPPNTDLDVANDFKTQQDLLFIVESDKSFLGRKLIIEYFRLHSRLELRRITLRNKDLLNSILSSSDYSKLADGQPFLIKLNEQDPDNMAAQILIRGEASNILPTEDYDERQEFIMDRFKVFIEQNYRRELEQIGGYVTPKGGYKKPTDFGLDLKQKSDMDIYYLVHHSSLVSGRIFAVDLLKGITFMITHEIKINGDLSPTQFATVRNILALLGEFLPLDKWDATMNQFILDLGKKLDDSREVHERRGITGEEMRDLLELTGADALKLRYSKENWVSCQDSERQYKGYPCSLWLLFHTLTVGEYSRAASATNHTSLVLSTMRDYITKFFGCSACSTNFEKESANFEASITAQNSAVIWLWDIHNKVNQRLNDEKLQDEKKPLMDVIYPSYRRCSQCYVDPIRYIGVDGKTLNDIEWRMSAVLETLLGTFNPDNVITPVQMAIMLKNVQGKVNYDRISAEIQSDFGGAKATTDMNQSDRQSIFSARDISLFLFLTFCCIVGLVCLSIIRKGTFPLPTTCSASSRTTKASNSTSHSPANELRLFTRNAAEDHP